MRVLMISKACIVGIYQRKLELIARQGTQLLAVVPPYWRDERGKQVFEPLYTEGYVIRVLPLVFNGNFHLHFYRRLAPVIREFQPQIVHIDEEPYNAATWQALYYSKKVGAKALFFSWQNIKRNYPPPFSWGERRVLEKIDYAIVGTDSAGAVWRAKGYQGPMRTIPQFGIDTGLFKPQPQRPERPFTIGYFGRVVQEKGVQDLLKAVSGLTGEWQLRVIGTGPYRQQLEKLAHQMKLKARTHFTEWLPSTDMPAQYQQLDAFVLPSLTHRNWKEQFGRVLIEAMASGVPVVGSDSGAIPDVIADAGLIYPEGNIRVLREHLQALQQDGAKRAYFACKGRKRVEARFTHESVARATAVVYRELLNT